MPIEIFRWIGVTVFGAVSLFFILGNPIWTWTARRAGRSYSWAPVFGGLAGAIAIMLAPVGTIRQRLTFAWIPFVLDLTIPLAIYFSLIVVPREFLRPGASGQSGRPLNDKTDEGRGR
jgi:hypothetical protein